MNLVYPKHLVGLLVALERKDLSNFELYEKFGYYIEPVAGYAQGEGLITRSLVKVKRVKPKFNSLTPKGRSYLDKVWDDVLSAI